MPPIHRSFLRLDHLSRHSRRLARRQRGYTLLELAIIGMFMGLLAVFSVDQISSRVGDTQKANAVWLNSKRLADGWSALWQFCGLSADSMAQVSVGNGASDAGANNISLLAGLVPANAGYTRCVATAGLRPMSTVMTGPAGSTKFMGYPTTWAYANVFGRHAVMVSYANVPEDVFLPLYRKHSKVAGAESTYSMVYTATDNTDPSFRYSAATTGRRTVSLIHTY